MGLAMDRSPYSRTGDTARGCWYYLRYFFLFLSLIQFLIILGLVLFMIYGNVHATTEASLRATEIRADSLYSQVVGLSASKANLTKQLNITAHAKDSVMQQLQSARREQDRINASFRQCQGDLVRGGLRVPNSEFFLRKPYSPPPFFTSNMASCSSGWSGTRCVAQDVLEFLTLMPLRCQAWFMWYMLHH